jgi:hypothetical protein
MLTLSRKIAISVMLLMLNNSCISFEKEHLFNTEIFCPENSKKMLILSARVDEVLRALKSALEYNQSSNKRSKYTVLRFDNDRSTSLYHVKPDYLLDKCTMKEISKKPI